MAGVDLNDPINWDELDDFDGEARELGGDFFFELENEGYSMNCNSDFNLFADLVLTGFFF